ncbi:MAG: DsbA family protein, partial [Dietzia sp.]|nr:DsbA family protein [Dietzia sp.]
ESASDLGLDLTAYDKAVSDPATAARLERDRADGIERGVQGTPTLFLTGRELTLTSLEDLEAQVAAAVTAAT